MLLEYLEVAKYVHIQHQYKTKMLSLKYEDNFKFLIKTIKKLRILLGPDIRFSPNKILVKSTLIIKVLISILTVSTSKGIEIFNKINKLRIKKECGHILQPSDHIDMRNKKISGLYFYNFSDNVTSLVIQIITITFQTQVSFARRQKSIGRTPSGQFKYRRYISLLHKLPTLTNTQHKISPIIICKTQVELSKKNSKYIANR
eukprot:TRINITY_DN12105_c0_g1_i5.p2 TRINITY_DN12105_c0_g1~~TRINITY_DN12105_c0_g1_i5.p2  ORF type:complete len:202 (+),score=-17.61 TRINITY_DN12105_c0_g1_i5:924-1529(+)